MYKEVEFRVRANEIDVNGKAAFHNLVNYFQEAAWLHVIDLGITGEELLKYDLMWVLSRMEITVFDYPKLHEFLKVQTFPSGFDKFFFYRDLRLFNADNELIAQASSTWLLVDVVKRKLALVPDFLKEMVTKIQRDDGLPIPKGKLPRLTEADFQSKVHVKWFDLDPNNHVNHIWYFKWILESLPNIIHETQTLKKVDIIFKNEVALGENLMVQAIDNQDDTFTHQILNEDKKVIIQAKSFWT